MLPFSDEPGVSRLDRLVEFRDPLGPAAKQFLPRLRSAFLVEAPETAERLARDNPSYIFLTPDGTAYQGRAVTGGRPTEAGPLAMKRELRTLAAEASRLETSLTELKSALEQLECERAQAEKSLETLTLEHVEAGKRVVGATLERDQARADHSLSGFDVLQRQRFERFLSLCSLAFELFERRFEFSEASFQA